MWRQVSDEATFWHVFAEFAQAKLAERVHEALVKTSLSDTLIGHISRDGTVVKAREKPAAKAPDATSPIRGKNCRDRPCKEEVQPLTVSRIACQRGTDAGGHVGSVACGR